METAAGAIIAAAAVATALFTLWRLVFRPLVAFHRKVAQSVEYIIEIREELGWNGGASLRDTVDRIEARVAFQDQRARALLQDAAHGYIETNHMGLLTFANRTHLRWTGRTLEELLGEGWINAIDPNDRKRLTEEWHDAVMDERDLITKFNILDTHGEVVPVRSHTYVIKSPSGDGTVLGWAAMIYRADERRGSPRR